MNILDHRILIPKSPQSVWAHVSDLSKNPTWQVDYSNLAFLTSRRLGVGVRWRYLTKAGHEYVAETTAWYDGLGYEYMMVDGVPFRENKGRIRLQDIPEGTIVQWTFTYDMGGLLSSVWNTLSYKRQFEGVMVDSLKMLWRVFNQTDREGTHEAKSLVREGLNYEARAQYRPRHPSTKTSQTPAPNANAPILTEPPISDEDTRPRVPVVVLKQEEGAGEPAFLASLQPLTSEALPSGQKQAVSATESSESKSQAATDENLVILGEPSTSAPDFQRSDSESMTSDFTKPPSVLPEQPVIVEIASPSPLVDSTSGTPATAAQMPLEKVVSDTSNDPTRKMEEVASVSDPSKATSGDVSVFDVFGVPKPSETQEMRAVTVPESTASHVQSVAIGPTKPPRSGLRLILRRKRVRLRRPS